MSNSPRGSIPETVETPGNYLVSIPSVNEIRGRALGVFGKRPCLWQANVCQAILEGNHDVISIAGTGMGKTLTFWLPLLFCPSGIQIIVTPLNILGQQNVETLGKAGVEGIFISAQTALFTNYRAIASLKYRVIVASPEALMKENGIFEHLFKDRLFMSSVISIVIDEVHCISQWGSFRPEYRDLGRLRYIQHYPCPIMATSATLTPSVIKDIKDVLHLRENRLFVSHCSVDRPNISIAVRPIQNTRGSFFDLKFLLRGWQPGSPPPPTFLVFFDSIPESIQAAEYLRKLLPLEYQDRVKWFNSRMSDHYKVIETAKLTNGETWGLMATDAFGMGMDIPNISTIVNWGTSCSLSTIWQRFGRCVRDQALEGVAVLFAEKENLDPEREKKADKAKQRKRSVQKKQDVGSSNKRQKAITTDPIKTEELATMPLDNFSSDDEQETATKQSGKGSKRRELDPDVDQLINAGYRGQPCRRITIMNSFQNDQSVFSHLECNPELPNGCSRCGPKLPRLCCDLHNPDEFKHIETAVVKTARQPPRSSVGKYIAGDVDDALRLHLETWRADEMRKQYGQAWLRCMGPGLVMGTTVRDRIVDCAHFSKIRSVADLERETKWDLANTHGESILNIIRSHYPLKTQLPLVIDLVNMTSSSSQPVNHIPAPFGPPTVTPGASNPSTTRRRSEGRCSLCQQTGHNSRNRGCPVNQRKENQLPASIPIASTAIAFPTPTAPVSAAPFSTFAMPAMPTTPAIAITDTAAAFPPANTNFPRSFAHMAFASTQVITPFTYVNDSLSSAYNDPFAYNGFTPAR